MSLVLCALPVCTPAAPRFTNADADVATVMSLVDARMALMPGVAAWKWQNKAAIADPERERAVIARAVQLATSMGLAPEGITALFELQVRAARDAQAALQQHWRESGFDFPSPVPSLDGEVRPQLDRLTLDLLRALHVAASEFDRADFDPASLDKAKGLLRAAGWTDAGKRELIAALAQVRRLPLAAPLERIAAAGVLRIGTTGDYAPFSSEQNGELHGADVDLGAALAAKLHVTPVFVRTSWPMLLDDLRADRFDVALGGISVTPAREAVAALSVPYSSGGKTIISRCADARRYRKLASVDRPGVRVIVNPGGTNEQFVRANVHRASVVVFADNRAIFDELRAGRADVMITDDVEVELQRRRHPDLCRALPGTLTHSDKAVLMPRDPALLGAINAWLTESIKVGEPARLLQQHLNH